MLDGKIVSCELSKALRANYLSSDLAGTMDVKLSSSSVSMQVRGRNKTMLK